MPELTTVQPWPVTWPGQTPQRTRRPEKPAGMKTARIIRSRGCRERRLIAAKNAAHSGGSAPSDSPALSRRRTYRRLPSGSGPPAPAVRFALVRWTAPGGLPVLKLKPRLLSAKDRRGLSPPLTRRYATEHDASRSRGCRVGSVIRHAFAPGAHGHEARPAMHVIADYQTRRPNREAGADASDNTITSSRVLRRTFAKVPSPTRRAAPAVRPAFSSP
jgi:hypothetical protein